MWLQARMYLLIALLFGILYGVITGLGTWMGAGSAISYLIIGFVFLGIQYLISPAIVGWSMKIKRVTEKEAPELRQKEVKLNTSQKLMEFFTTHPNMLKRIKHLSTLSV